MSRKLLTFAEAARKYGTSRQRLEEAARRGLIHPVEVQVVAKRLDPAEVEAYLSRENRGRPRKAPSP